MLKKATIVIGIMFLALVSNANAQSAADPTAAIKQTALDYIEGWYEGIRNEWSAPFIPS
jgi:hypothetical protein